MEKKKIEYITKRMSEDNKIGNALGGYKNGNISKKDCIAAIEESVLEILKATDEYYGGADRLGNEDDDIIDIEGF